MFQRTMIDPGPDYVRLDERVVKRKRIAIDWDKGSVNPDNPLVKLPTGLYITIGTLKRFVSVEDLIKKASGE